MNEPGWLVVESVAWLATVQDLGRPGWAHLGVPRAGAVDPPALALANRLVGNPADAAGLEALLGGVRVRVERATRIAVTGAAAPVQVAGRPAPAFAAVSVPTGASVEIGRPTWGARVYLGVAGGLEPPAVLGSRSCDVRNGLGPPPLRPGDRVPLGQPHRPGPAVDVAAASSGAGRPALLRVHPGPRSDWLLDSPAGALSGLCGPDGWQVAPASDRAGLRLDGPVLRVRQATLDSEGAPDGSVQVPPNGQPVVFLAEHPTTGGYPVVAVVDPADLPLAGQLLPGDALAFRRA